MSERFGIKEYAGEKNLSEIFCIMKRFYSDFIVIEIPVANLILQPVVKEKKIKRSLSIDNNSNYEISTTKRLKSDENIKEESEIDTLLYPKALTADDITNIDNIFKEIKNDYSINVQALSKEERKKIYDYLRQKYGRALVANSKEGVMEFRRLNKYSISDARDAGGENADTDEGHCPKGHYLRFYMTKENKETHYALNIIAKLTGLKTAWFNVAGTKDRRGITTQLVSIAKVSKKKVRNIKSKLREIWINNLHYSPEKLQMGSLWGNHFEIALRDLNMNQLTTDELDKRVQNWSTTGFLNYFGHQRFGSVGGNTADIGRYILANKWEDAVKAILVPKEDVYGPIAEVLNEFKATGNAKQALLFWRDKSKTRNRSMSIEENILTFLSANPTNFHGAILNLPRDLRSLYIHAYQSIVFNKILTKRVQKFGLNVIEGDLNLEGKPILEISEASLMDVSLPLPSLNDNLPKNEIGEWYKELAIEDGISNELFGELEKHFVISDVYRPILIKPINVSHNLIKYNDDNAVLQVSVFKENFKNNNLLPKLTNKPKFALLIKFDLPACSYATIALRELLHTDFSKSVQKKREEEIRRSVSNEKEDELIKSEIVF